MLYYTALTINMVPIPTKQCDVNSIKSFFGVDGKSNYGIEGAGDYFSFDDENGCSVVCSIIFDDDFGRKKHHFMFTYYTSHGYYFVIPKTAQDVEFLGRIVARYASFCSLPNVGVIVSNTIDIYREVLTIENDSSF